MVESLLLGLGESGVYLARFLTFVYNFMAGSGVVIEFSLAAACSQRFSTCEFRQYLFLQWIWLDGS